MAKFLIRLNCSCAGRFNSADEKTFGPRNAGVIVEAENEKAAAAAFNESRSTGARYNPFYLTIKQA